VRISIASAHDVTLGIALHSFPTTPQNLALIYYCLSQIGYPL